MKLSLPSSRSFYRWGAIVLLVLIITGLFIVQSWIHRNEAESIAGAIFHEKETLSEELNQNAGEISFQCVRFAELLSQNVESALGALGVSRIQELSGRRQELEQLMRHSYGLTYSALEWLETTGVFVVLDASVNPRGGNSRVGMAIENTEPYIRSLQTPKLYLRGFPSIAFDNNLNLRYHWRLEFEVEGHDLWEKPLAAYRDHPELPLDCLLHWSISPSLSLKEPSAVCSIPLIDSRGRVMGVCGFTASVRFLKTIHTLADSSYQSLTTLLHYLPALELIGASHKAHHPAQTLTTGNVSIYRELLRQGLPLSVVEKSPEDRSALEHYQAQDGTEYLGLSEKVKLYRKKSPFSSEEWRLTVVMPRKDYDQILYNKDYGPQVVITLVFIIMLILVLYSIFATRVFKLPPEPHAPNLEGYGLSKREKEICLLLLQGLSIKQIGLQLNISFSTANTHYHSLYRKLGISSKAELFIKFKQ